MIGQFFQFRHHAIKLFEHRTRWSPERVHVRFQGTRSHSSIQSRGSFNPKSAYQKRSPNRAEPYPNATTINKNIGTVTAAG